MRLSNSESGELDWTGFVKTARYFIVTVGGAVLVVLIEQLMKVVIPDVNLGEYAWIRPALLVGCSTALEALRRFMTDYSNNS